MATYTPNLNLKKPTGNEHYDVVAEDNDAKDKIDTAIGNHASQLAEKAKKCELIFSQEKLSTESDSVCLQRLIDKLAINGGTVLIDIDLVIDTPIIVKSNVKIKGDSLKRMIKCADNTTIPAIFRVEGDIDYTSLETLQINGNQLGGAVTSGLVFASATNVYIDNCFFKQLYITQCKIYGLYVPSTFMCLRMSEITTSYCGNNGVYHAGSDATLNDFNIFSCGITAKVEGFISSGGNNKISNIKVFFCGDFTTAKAGMKILQAFRSSYYNIDAQENYYCGLSIVSSFENSVKVISDRNNAGEVASGTLGVFCSSGYKNTLNIICTNNTNGLPQDIGIKIDTNSFYNNEINAMISDSHVNKFVDKFNASNDVIINGSTLYPYDITPNFTLIDTVLNGITFSKLGNHSMKLDGTATATASFYVFGAYNQTASFFVIPASTDINLELAKIPIAGVSLQLLKDGTVSSYSSTMANKVNNPTAINITGFIVKVNADTVLSNVMLTPKLLTNN